MDIRPLKRKHISYGELVISIVLSLALGAISTTIIFAENSTAAFEIASAFMPIQNDTPLSMPKDRISEDQIRVFDNYVIIEIDDPEWSRFAATGSMRPFLDQGANAIQVKPESPQDLIVGDVISYQSPLLGGIIIHRIIEIGEDEQGWFARVQGDANQGPDPGRVRFEQIHRVLVAIIY